MRKMEEAFLRDAMPWTRETFAAAIQDGEDSGEAGEIDMDRLFDEVLAEHRRQP